MVVAFATALATCALAAPALAVPFCQTEVADPGMPAILPLKARAPFEDG
jgi:hypothetical protein